MEGFVATEKQKHGERSEPCKRGTLTGRCQSRGADGATADDQVGSGRLCETKTAWLGLEKSSECKRKDSILPSPQQKICYGAHLQRLIRHGALSGCRRGSCERENFEQSRDKEQRDHGDAQAQPRQGELRQQGDCAFTDAAQVAAHADHAVKGKVHERAAVEAMTGQRLFGRIAGSGPGGNGRDRRSLRRTV